jgi:hypothetical protein
MPERLAVLLYGQVVGQFERTAGGELPTFSSLPALREHCKRLVRQLASNARS